MSGRPGVFVSYYHKQDLACGIIAIIFWFHYTYSFYYFPFFEKSMSLNDSAVRTWSNRSSR